MRAAASKHDRLVGQLVARRRRRAANASRRRSPIARDAVQRRRRRSARAERRSPSSRQIASHAVVADLRVDAAVGDDLDVAVGEQQVDEHAVVVLGVPDAQRAEHLERALARRDAAPHARERQRGLDGEARPGPRAASRLRRSRARCARAPRAGTRDARRRDRSRSAATGGGRARRAVAPSPALPTRRRRRSCRRRRRSRRRRRRRPSRRRRRAESTRRRPAARRPPTPAASGEQQHHERDDRGDDAAISSEPSDEPGARADERPRRRVDPPTCRRCGAGCRPRPARRRTARISSISNREPADAARLRLRRRLAPASGSPLSTTAMIWSTPASMPCANWFCAEQRRDRLGDDAPRRRVGQHAFEAVADLDAQLAVVLGDDQQRAVVLALAADLPRLGHADANTPRSAPAASSARCSTASWLPVLLLPRGELARAPASRRPTASA